MEAIRNKNPYKEEKNLIFFELIVKIMIFSYVVPILIASFLALFFLFDDLIYYIMLIWIVTSHIFFAASALYEYNKYLIKKNNTTVK